LHIFEDHFYPEIIDPATGEVQPDGIEGELVLTTLSEAGDAHDPLPHSRYRHAFLPGRCECGRTLRRISRVGRRSDDMLIVRGVNVFPSQVESALLQFEGTLPQYQILLTREHGLDQMEVQVEVTPQMFNDKIGALQELHDKLEATLDRVLGLRVQVALVEARSLQRSEGKARRVIDRRTT
jgi:phenylacetate-CoA ligase